MGKILENELLGFCYRPLGEVAIALADKLSDEEAEVLRTALVNFLLDETKHGSASLVDVTVVEVPVARDFKSILYRDGGTDGTKKIVTFSFHDAVIEIALPLLGIAITVFTGKWGIVTLAQIGGILKTLWSKLVTLKLPADADAIEVLEAIVRVRARRISKGSEEYPANVDLEQELDLPSEAVYRALSRLKSLAVIESVNWGGQAEDVSHPANQWRVKL
ncbi:MAG: hypothetical protein ACJ76Y_02870 [Thermoanaerobaculia bacterium]